MTGISVPHISPSQISNYQVAIPPIEEQREIFSFINKESQSIDDLKSRAEQEITLIQEYRTRLIADVVTGKVDVRHLAPTEPPPPDDLIDDDLDDDALLDEAEAALDPDRTEGVEWKG